MANPEYFHRQAALCERLAETAGGQLALRYKLLAYDLRLKAANTEGEGDTHRAHSRRTLLPFNPSVRFVGDGDGTNLRGEIPMRPD